MQHDNNIGSTHCREQKINIYDVYFQFIKKKSTTLNFAATSSDNFMFEWGTILSYHANVPSNMFTIAAVVVNGYLMNANRMQTASHQHKC